MTSTTEPSVGNRPEQPYVAIRGRVTMDSIKTIADRIPELMEWLAANDVPAAGAPFLKYGLFEGTGTLEIEAAVPVSELPETATSDAIVSGTVPAGRFASLIWIGPVDGLRDETERLLKWAAGEQLSFDTVDTPSGERWGARLEIYHTDPAADPDQTRWTTELAFRLAD